jgi:hypothetical protein
MSLKSLQWKNIEHKNISTYSKKADKFAEEKHLLPKYVKLQSDEEFNIAIGSDEIKELLQFTGGTLNTDKWFTSRHIIRIEYNSDDTYNTTGFQIMPDGQILWNHYVGSKSYIGRHDNFYESVQFLL